MRPKCSSLLFLSTREMHFWLTHLEYYISLSKRGIQKQTCTQMALPKLNIPKNIPVKWLLFSSTTVMIDLRRTVFIKWIHFNMFLLLSRYLLQIQGVLKLHGIIEKSSKNKWNVIKTKKVLQAGSKSLPKPFIPQHVFGNSSLSSYYSIKTFLHVLYYILKHSCV